MAVMAGLRRRLDHAGAQALARHLHQAEARDAADLDARAVGLQLVLEALLDGSVVLALFHVDEVDHDQAREVAQAQLARHLVGGLQVRVQRGLLDRAFLGRLAGVHVDRDQRLGDADDDVAAGFQTHDRIEHPVEIAFHLVPREQGQRVGVLLHVLGVGRHDHLHEVLGVAVARLALDQDFVDLAVVEVADRALDQVAFLVDLGGREGFQRQLPDLLPQPLQVFVVALDLRLGALGARGADDQARAFRYVELGRDLLELLAVCRLGDLAGDPAAARGVRHQHAVAARQRQVGRQRGALVAALFLDHLDQHDLPDLDDFLDLVAARTRLLAARTARLLDLFLDVVGLDVLDGVVVLGLFRLVLVERNLGLGLIGLGRCLGRLLRGHEIGRTGSRHVVRRRLVAGRLRILFGPGLCRGLFGCVRGVFGRSFPGSRSVRLGRSFRGFDRDLDRFGGNLGGFRFGRDGFDRRLGRGLFLVPVRRNVDHRHGTVIGTDRRQQRIFLGGQVHDVHAGDVAAAALSGGFPRFRRLRIVAVARLRPGAAARLALAFALAVLVVAVLQRFRIGAFLGHQRFAVGHRDLVVIRVDLREGQEAVAVAAVIDEGSLERRLYARDLCQVDIASQLALVFGLKVEFLDFAAVDHDDPGLFRVRGIDEHFLCHYNSCHRPDAGGSDAWTAHGRYVG